MNGRVLVLNASFEPINVCTERRAVVMIFKGVARMEEHNGHMLHSAKLSLNAPPAIGLPKSNLIPFKRRSSSRKKILFRNTPTSNYCAKQNSPPDPPLDTFTRARAAATRRGIIWWRAASVATIARAIGRRKNPGCISCVARADSRSTLIVRSCAIWDAPMRHGASICFMNRTLGKIDAGVFARAAERRKGVC